MIGADCGIDVGRLLPVLVAMCLALLIFGFGYNLITEKAEKTGFIRGYTSLFVVGGVAVTVAATAVVNYAFAVITAVAFVFSGTPMIVGSMVRHKREELCQLQQAREEARHGDSPKKVASEL